MGIVYLIFSILVICALIAVACVTGGSDNDWDG